MGPFLVLRDIAVGSAGGDTAPVSRTGSGRMSGRPLCPLVAQLDPCRAADGFCLKMLTTQQTSFPQSHVNKQEKQERLSTNKPGTERWKLDEITDISRTTPVREEERCPISLSYSALQSTIQQYYLLYDKRAFYSNMMWSVFAWKISSVFSKILLVSQRENGDYTSKPWASMPIAGAFVQHRTNTGYFLNCNNSDNYLAFLECFSKLDELPPVRQEPLQVFFFFFLSSKLLVKDCL